MLGVNRHDAVQRSGNPVDAESLIVGGVVGLGLDQTLVCQKLIVLAGGRILHHQLKGTVALLTHLTGDSVRKRTEAEGRELCCVCSV